MSSEKISNLKDKLKKSDPDVRQYIAELEKRNAKLQLQIVKLEANKLERDNKIKALKKASPSLKIVLPPMPKLSDDKT